MRWPSINIKQKLLLLICLLLFFSLVGVTALTYITYRDDLVAQSTETTQLLLDQLTINLDQYIGELYRLCLSPYYDRQTMLQLETVPQTASERLQKRRIIEEYLGEMMTLPREDILRAHILTDDIYSTQKTRNSASISKDFEKEDWFQAAMKTPQPIFIPVQIEDHGRSTLYVFSIVQQLRSLTDGRVLGVIRVDANYQGIRAVCDRALAGRENALAIVDSKENQIYLNSSLDDPDILPALLAMLPQEQQTSTTLCSGGEDYLVNIKSLSQTDWRIVDIHAMRQVTHTATNALNRSIFLALLCAVAAVLVSIFAVRWFVQPIYQITGLMSAVQQGDFSVRAEAEGNDEFAFLARSFNEMTGQMDSVIQNNNLLTRKIYEARYLEKEAQYIALYSQMQPHFLFNTLSTIQLLIKRGDTSKAEECLSMLSILLRGMVNTRRNIPLQSEMKIVASYLSIQQMRFDTLQYSIHVTKDLESYLLPALTIQPIVENALIHGCEPKKWDAKVSISAETTKQEVCITICDNGVGMSAETLASLRQSLLSDNEDFLPSISLTSGVGLINISRRIRLKYGPDYGLAIDSIEGQGTVVTVRLPHAKEET